MAYWLVKTEPETYSIDDLKRDKTTLWDKVRNYQARNYLRAMARGDSVFVYHSNAEPSGIVGIATVSKEAVADPTQFETGTDYHDPKATPDSPRWFSPELKFARKLPRLIELGELRDVKALRKMVLLQKGSRLSVQPVTEEEFQAVLALV